MAMMPMTVGRKREQSEYKEGGGNECAQHYKKPSKSRENDAVE